MQKGYDWLKTEILGREPAEALAKLGEALAANAPKAPELRGDFELNKSLILKENPREAAVVLLLAPTQVQGELALVLQQRSQAVKDHPGQISFPGGKREPEDKSSLINGLRELHEEMDVWAEPSEVLASLPPYASRTGFRIAPHIVGKPTPVTTQPQVSEVEHIFWLPLRALARPEAYRQESHEAGNQLYRWHTFEVAPYRIWGVTAGILTSFFEQAYGWPAGAYGERIAA